MVAVVVGGWVVWAGLVGVGIGSIAVMAGPALDALVLLASFVCDLLRTCSLSHCLAMTFGNLCVFAFPRPWSFCWWK